MRVKNLNLVNGDHYSEVEILPIGIVLPEEMDSMIALTVGKTTIYVNAAMIVSFEPDTQMRVV